MFKLLKCKQGQAVYTEYAITFFMVAGIIIAMSTYVKRAVQGRIYSAHQNVFVDVNAVFTNPVYNFQGNIWAQYEPYYVTNSIAQKRYSSSQITTITPAGRDGVVEYRDSSRSRSDSSRDQPAPAFAD